MPSPQFRSRFLNNALKALVAMACLTMPHSGYAETMKAIEAASEAIHPFYCQPTVGEPALYIITPVYGSTNGEMLMLPSGINARLLGDVYTADVYNGTISLRDGEFVSLTDDGTVTGVCRPFKREIMSFFDAMLIGNPKALSTLADQASLSDYAFRLQQAEDANKVLVAQIAARDLSKNPAEQKIDKLSRENDKLKRRVCELDPKATFSVCKDGSAP